MAAAFSGTVVDCRTRFQVDKPTTAFLTHFDANWILTIRIERADEGLPVTAGKETAFAIHSPVVPRQPVCPTAPATPTSTATR
jgi:hypothetical protein